LNVTDTLEVVEEADPVAAGPEVVSVVEAREIITVVKEMIMVAVEITKETPTATIVTLDEATDTVVVVILKEVAAVEVVGTRATIVDGTIMAIREVVDQVVEVGGTRVRVQVEVEDTKAVEQEVLLPLVDEEGIAKSLVALAEADGTSKPCSTQHDVSIQRYQLVLSVASTPQNNAALTNLR